MQDNVIPKIKWQFDEEVAASFENMLERSIPDYKEMRRLCFEIANSSIKSKSKILDLGSSHGEAVASFVEKNECFAVEISKPMVEVLYKRFKPYIESKKLKICEIDLRKEFIFEKFDFVFSVLCLQFIPINYRQKILSLIFDSLNSGGSFILVEKVLGSSARIDDLFVSNYHKYKEKIGKYTKEQIKRKSLSLEGVLVPVTAEWNEELLKKAGFNQVDCFWRNLNFCGWIAIKD
jgi:tRNA (cmo5U34)-methyltransferase